MKLTPVRMTPAFRFGSATPWGGEGLRALGKAIPDPRTGESLEVSVLPGLESRDEAGRTLTALLAEHGEAMRGTHVGEVFPLLLKLITFPMVKKSYMSSAKMRVLKPRLEAATAKFDKPEDQMQKQQAMMAEYAKYGVSPLSGCLPMLIQMPIWIAMFNFVPNAIQLRGQSFLWMDDLSTYDPIIEWSHSLPIIGDHLSLTCILFCISNVLYSWMTMRQQRDQMVGQQAEQMKMMQWMMYIMPVMFFFIFNDYSSGLNFYYFISLFFSALIMWALRKTTNDEKLLALLDARYKENQNNPQKLRGLAARLQAMQEQQAKLQQQREEMERRRRK